MRLEINLWLYFAAMLLNIAAGVMTVIGAIKNAQTARRLKDEAAILMAVSKRLGTKVGEYHP